MFACDLKLPPRTCILWLRYQLSEDRRVFAHSALETHCRIKITKVKSGVWNAEKNWKESWTNRCDRYARCVEVWEHLDGVLLTWESFGDTRSNNWHSQVDCNVLLVTTMMCVKKGTEPTPTPYFVRDRKNEIWWHDVLGCVCVGKIQKG